MSLFVYVSENCVEDARKHNLAFEVQRLQDRVEETQSTNLFVPFPPPYLVKKKLGGRQGRLIAEKRTVGDHAVIICLALLIRGHRAYEEFSQDPLAYGKRHFVDLVSEAEVTAFVAERTAARPLEVRPDPSEAEYGLLYGAFSHHGDLAPDELVCETQEWVEQVAQGRISKQIALLCRPCLSALGKEPGLHFIPVPEKPGWGVWALKSQSRLLLITPATESDSTTAENLAHKVAEQLSSGSSDDVLRASRRAYPAIILADDELWIDLENEPVANMALSPEESAVLESARGPDHPFPLFINGRAGSGKSTILQYLFSDLLFHYLSKPEARVVAPPVYLTANGELLRVARTFVERLLRSEAAFTQQSGVSLVEDSRDVMDEAFREFQPHLLSLVPVEERLSRFAKGARVDYSGFRRHWMERFGKDNQALRQFSPDLSWHVIRTYVKGMSSETHLEPEDYALLPDNQISVTHEAFKLVYDRVWNGWYEPFLEENGMWDDQDLTRYVLENNLATPKYPAVFCDEAQDFTRLELELLLRLNLFSNRAVPPNDISRVPFAFAGDQFQTLNPTGFRWDAIKASFVEKFIFELDPAQRSGRTDLNYCELEYNYRSTDKIVRFGNHVQAMRSALFGLPDLKPQTPWAAQPQSFPVVWFRANDGEFWKKYREQTGFVVIVPCNEGEEASYVSGDPILREQIKVEDGVPLNVLSAGRAKGCEYPAVIVYGFGQAAEVDLVAKLVAGPEDAEPDPDKTLPIQYFINRLYVAVSRPKRRLIIVDTDKGFEKLWKCAQEESAEAAMLHQIKHGQAVWAPAIEGMTMGDAADLTRESAGDPLENARAFELDGIARQDAFLLRQAAQAYRSGSDLAKAKECRARAFDAEGQFLEAGTAFFDAGFVIDGVRCLWRAGVEGWTLLRDELGRHPQIQSELEYQLASRIVGRTDLKSLAEVLRIFAKRLENAEFAGNCASEPVWRDALGVLLQRALEARPTALESGGFDDIVVSMDLVRTRGLRLPRASAQIYFHVRRYADAIALWDEMGATKSADYLSAKAKVEPYPKNVAALSNLGLNDEILKGYSDHPNEPLTAEQAPIVVTALRKARRVDEAFALAERTSSGEAMLGLCLDLFGSGDRERAGKALHAGLVLLVRQGQWEVVGSYAATRKLVPAPDWKNEDITKWVHGQIETLQVALVRALARADELPDAPAHFQRQLTEFLRAYLRTKDGKWLGRISVKEAGAAIERAGKFVEALVFYEAIEKGRYSAVDQDFAKERWLVCKERQLEHERASGATNKARKIGSEIRDKMANIGLPSLVDLPRFPILQPLPIAGLKPLAETESVLPSALSSPDTVLPEPIVPEPVHVSAVIDRFKVDVSRVNGRCNITNTNTMETAYLKIAERRCGGEVEFIEVEPGCWSCEAWDLTVQFPTIPGQPVSIDDAAAGVSLSIRW